MTTREGRSARNPTFTLPGLDRCADGRAEDVAGVHGMLEPQADGAGAMAADRADGPATLTLAVPSGSMLGTTSFGV